jgi:hypothetical protein
VPAPSIEPAHPAPAGNPNHVRVRGAKKSKDFDAITDGGLHSLSQRTYQAVRAFEATPPGAFRWVLSRFDDQKERAQAMETGANITAAMFAAYLKCRTKAYLTAHREKPPEPVFVEMRKRVSAAYKAQRPNTESTVPINFSRLADGPMDDAATVVVDCETVSYTCEGSAPASVDPRAKRADSGRQNVNPLFCLGQNRPVR